MPQVRMQTRHVAADIPHAEPKGEEKQSIAHDRSYGLCTDHALASSLQTDEIRSCNSTVDIPESPSDAVRI